jgi:hypothetical protein
MSMTGTRRAYRAVCGENATGKVYSSQSNAFLNEVRRTRSFLARRWIYIHAGAQRSFVERGVEGSALHFNDASYSASFVLMAQGINRAWARTVSYSAMHVLCGASCF